MFIRKNNQTDEATLNFPAGRRFFTPGQNRRHSYGQMCIICIIHAGSIIGSAVERAE